MTEAHPRNRAVAAIGATALFIASLYPAFIAFLLLGFRCWEGCTVYRGQGTRPDVSWRDTADAWQWDFQFALAGAATLAVGAAIVLAASGRFRWAVWTAGAGVVLEGVWCSFISGGPIL